MGKIVRMRTIKQTSEFFKQEDSETKINEHFLRLLVKQRKIPCFLAGSRQLINLDVLIDYLNGESAEDVSIPFNDYGRLRQIKE